jgi:Cation/multidrug efflux pump
MTSLATVFGLLPMAIGWGTGGETNAPLARAVVGGLSFSTILTLFLVPTIYVMLEERFPRHADRAPEEADWIPTEHGPAPLPR